MNPFIIDILGVSEVRWPAAGYIWSGEYRFIYSGTSVENPGRGVIYGNAWKKHWKKNEN